jgi:hypothetical protein
MDAMGWFLGKPQASSMGLSKLGLPSVIPLRGWIELANFTYIF